MAVDGFGCGATCICGPELFGRESEVGWFGAVVEHTTGYKKELDVLFENDLVINFTYVKVPIESQKETGAHFGD